MVIRALTLTSFRLRTKEAVVLLGQPSRRQEADIVIAAETTEKVRPKKRKEVFWVPGPGEYEIAGVEIWGGEKGFWILRLEGLKLVYWESAWRLPSDQEIESWGAVAAMIFSLDSDKELARKAAEMVKRTSPSVAVVAQSSASKEFLDQLDREDIKPEEELSIKSNRLPEETRLVVLKVKS